MSFSFSCFYFCYAAQKYQIILLLNNVFDYFRILYAMPSAVPFVVRRSVGWLCDGVSVYYTEKTYMPRSGFSLNFTRVPLFSGKNIPAANTRVLKGLRKWLSVSGLHFSAVSRTSFRVAKEPLSGSDIAFFACRYGLFQPVKRCFSQSDMGSFAGSRVGGRSAMCFSRF